MIRIVRLATVFAAVTAVLLSAGAELAAASGPWWHLGAVLRPALLRTGAASQAVQDVTVTGTEHELFVLANLSAGEVKEIEEGKRSPEKFAILEVGASTAELRAGLEQVYGTGNVEVSGGVGTKTGAEPYRVAFVGALEDEPMQEINSGLSPLVGFAGTVAVDQVSHGVNSGELAISAVNLGDEDVAEGAVVKLSDHLPPGVKALGAQGIELGRGDPLSSGSCSLSGPHEVSCEFAGPVMTYHGFEARIRVGGESDRAAGETEENEISVEGGGVTASRSDTLRFGGAPTFGIESYEFDAEDEGGGPDTQAGSHPFQVTTTLNLNQDSSGVTPGLAKDIKVKLPPGLVGNVTRLSQCSLAKFHEIRIAGGEAETRCPASSAIGAASVLVNRIEGLADSKLYRVIVPVFNVEPARGEPARFGLFVPEGDVPVLLDTSLRAGEDYGVTVSASNTSQAVALLSSEVTIWGVPGDPRHDRMRGYACLDNPNSAECLPSVEQHPAPLLSMPASCNGPLATSAEVDSWGSTAFESATPPPVPGMTGCNQLPFDPTVSLSPQSHQASTPSGWTVRVHVPQTPSENAAGRVEAMPRDITVALPAGVDVNASAADGLQACSEPQIGFLGFKELNPSAEPGRRTAQFTPAAASCPAAAKVANVTIATPLLPNLLEGAMYLASPQNFAGGPEQNPFRSLLAMYLLAEDPVSGVRVKLAGRGRLDPVTGQITTTFESSPQAPFEDAEVDFFDGSRAPLATPAHCGSYQATGAIGPWSSEEAMTWSSLPFEILAGAAGAPCASQLPLAPSLAAGSLNVNAGGFAPLTTSIARGDGDQSLQSVQVHLPAGVSGVLTGIPLCREAEANAGTCSPASRIGSTVVSVGLGGSPYTVTGGKVYLTEKYAGAPFGLSIVTPAQAGPFILQEGRPVVVRAKVEVDPRSAAITVTSDPLPHIVEGFPLEIKRVNVTVDRPSFTFNPTNCSALEVSGQVGGLEGAVAPVATPFRVTNCSRLRFGPAFTASTSGATSRANGASLKVKLSYPKAPLGTQANIKSVHVELPKALPSRLSTLREACPDSVFDRDPGACPSQSRVGSAKAVTPVLPVALEGPAYFVSHGGAKFPELIIVLQGDGVTVDLAGETFISKAGVTSSTFNAVPDVPVENFELNLPEGPFSALAANRNLCTASLAMPTTFHAQDGTILQQRTPIEVQGCPYALRVLRRKVSKRNLSLAVSVPGGGRLVASGKGVTRASATSNGRQTLTLRLTERKAGRLRTNIALRFTPNGTAGRQRAKTAKVLRKRVTVTFG